jgi:hypothetical protein
MKHSKGSWIVDGNGLTNDWDVSNHQSSIATVNKRADAVLIAAAPELLEALSEARGYLLYYSMDPNTQDNDVKKVMRKADQALKKARGES